MGAKKDALCSHSHVYLSFLPWGLSYHLQPSGPVARGRLAVSPVVWHLRSTSQERPAMPDLHGSSFSDTNTVAVASPYDRLQSAEAARAALIGLLAGASTTVNPYLRKISCQPGAALMTV